MQFCDFSKYHNITGIFTLTGQYVSLICFPWVSLRSLHTDLVHLIPLLTLSKGLGLVRHLAVTTQWALQA